MCLSTVGKILHGCPGGLGVPGRWRDGKNERFTAGITASKMMMKVTAVKKVRIATFSLFYSLRIPSIPTVYSMHKKAWFAKISQA